MSWRNAGKGVGVGVGVEVDVGDGLGRGVGIGLDVRPRLGCGVGDGSGRDAWETESDGSAALSVIGAPELGFAGVSWTPQPVPARTVSRAQATSVSTNLVLHVLWDSPWRPGVTLVIVC
jgi:hypothetical protein